MKVKILRILLLVFYSVVAQILFSCGFMQLGWDPLMGCDQFIKILDHTFTVEETIEIYV